MQEVFRNLKSVLPDVLAYAGLQVQFEIPVRQLESPESLLFPRSILKEVRKCRITRKQFLPIASQMLSGLHGLGHGLALSLALSLALCFALCFFALCFFALCFFALCFALRTWELKWQR